MKAKKLNNVSSSKFDKVLKSIILNDLKAYKSLKHFIKNPESSFTAA